VQAGARALAAPGSRRAAAGVVVRVAGTALALAAFARLLAPTPAVAAGGGTGGFAGMVGWWAGVACGAAAVAVAVLGVLLWAPVDIELLFADAQRPDQATSGSAGFDVFAHLRGRTVQVVRRGAAPDTALVVDEVMPDGPGAALRLLPGERATVPLGFKLTLPWRTKMAVWPKSGRARNEGLAMINGIGLIDRDYPNEVAALVVNDGLAPLVIEHGQACAQVTFGRYLVPRFRSAVVRPIGARTGGFGSTGLRRAA
jgi:dUTP pyrophosphatase